MTETKAKRKEEQLPIVCKDVILIVVFRDVVTCDYYMRDFEIKHVELEIIATYFNEIILMRRHLKKCESLV